MFFTAIVYIDTVYVTRYYSKFLYIVDVLNYNMHSIFFVFWHFYYGK